MYNILFLAVTSLNILILDFNGCF